MIPIENPYEPSADGYFAAHARKQGHGRRLANEAHAMLGRTGTMLELGCGRGDLLAGAQSVGWTVRGVEMTPAFCEIARAGGVDVEQATIQDCAALSEPWDVILLAAVLEHLYDPTDTLRRARAALRPGGLLFVDVPNERALALRAGSLYRRLQGRDWCQYLSPTFSPYHVVGFSPRSLRAALHRAGLEVISLRVVRYSNLAPTGGLRRRLERAAMGALQTVGAAIGHGDGLVCWARAPV
jgi:2-polyprenyl-3-methyl-5-hydroxy-6-metoxy-1,4-benzoquinol methylase